MGGYIWRQASYPAAAPVQVQQCRLPPCNSSRACNATKALGALEEVAVQGDVRSANIAAVEKQLLHMNYRR